MPARPKKQSSIVYTRISLVSPKDNKDKVLTTASFAYQSEPNSKAYDAKLVWGWKKENKRHGEQREAA